MVKALYIHGWLQKFTSCPILHLFFPYPQETRPLTVREYARVQTFPDDWQFTGSLSSQYKQIGNAVPVNMAYHLGRCLIATLKGEKELPSPAPEIKQLSIPGLSA